MADQTAYERILDVLRIELDARRESGIRMPTEAELCDQFEVSRQTVRRAYAELVSEGLIYRVPGRGTFVSNRGRAAPYLRSFGTVDDILGLSFDTRIEVTSGPGTEVNQAIARELKLQSDDTIVVLEMVRYHKERPLSLTKISLTPEIGGRLVESGFPQEPGATVISHIEGFVSGGISGVEQDITAVRCPLHVANYLDLEVGSPSLLTKRIYLDRDGRPVEHAVGYYDPSVYSYHVRLGRAI